MKNNPDDSAYMATFYLYLTAIYSIAVSIIPVLGHDKIDAGIQIRQGEPNNVIAQKNGQLMLNCSVTLTDSDQGPLEYTWTKDGEPIEDHIQLQNNGSLYFRRVIHKPRRNKTDMGFYECYVKNKIGSIIARRVNVDIASMSKNFIQEPQPQRVSVGAVARFQCQINAVPSALYVWEKDRTALPQDNVRFIVLSSGILQIINVQESDAGQYRCIATQGALHELPDEVLAIHRRDSSEAALEVSSDSGTKLLRIIAGPGNVTALVGSTVILECLIEGAALSIQWERKDGVIRSDGHVTKVGNNLKFVEVKFEDSGEYTCHGIGDNLTRVASTGNLSVYRPPVSKEDDSSVRYPPAKLVRFKCSVEGTPKPIIIWLKDGKKLKPDGRIRFDRNDLVITASNPSDSGYYQCIAENKVGFTSVFARFFVRKPSLAPLAPEDLRAEDIGSTEIKLVWKRAMAKPSSPILAYSVHYRAEGDSNALNQVLRDTEVMLSNLSPYTNYSIYVLPYASTGAGPKSNTIIVQTKEDFPRKAPNIKLIGEPGKILVEWEEIPRKDRNGLIVKYQIHYREMGLPDTLKVEDNIPPTVMFHTITGLKTDTEYEVRMLAATSMGYPTLAEKNWPWIKVHTTAISGQKLLEQLLPMTTPAPKKQCPATDTCIRSCTDIIKLGQPDKDGCRSCQCVVEKPEPPTTQAPTREPDFLTLMRKCPETVHCMKICKNGCTLEACQTGSCPTCRCHTDTTFVLICEEQLYCPQRCSVGYKCDETSGCPTCTCIKPSETKLAVHVETNIIQSVQCGAKFSCAERCSFGYKTGNNGCPTCDCLEAVLVVDSAGGVVTAEGQTNTFPVTGGMTHVSGGHDYQTHCIGPECSAKNGLGQFLPLTGQTGGGGHLLTGVTTNQGQNGIIGHQSTSSVSSTSPDEQSSSNANSSPTQSITDACMETIKCVRHCGGEYTLRYNGRKTCPSCECGSTEPGMHWPFILCGKRSTYHNGQPSPIPRRVCVNT